jgi:predicted ATPase
MDYEPSPEGLGQIAQLCRWVEGMPLAILLASSWMELLSPGEIVAQMAGADGQRLDLLAADYGDLPERQRSMRAVFDYSWRLLEPRQAEVLATLSVFSSPFTVEAAREVAGASLRDLLHLVDRSLLQRAGMERYSIHDLLRRYAAEQLRSLGGVEAALDRHAAYYARELARRAPDAHRARSSFLHALDAESGNILAAWEWAVARRQLDWLDQAADGFSDWQAFEQQIPSGERLFARAVQAAKALPSSGKQARVSARLLYHQVVFRGHQEDVEAQRALVKECAALIVEAQRLGEDARIEQARVLRRTAYVADSAPECRALLERALSLARETGNGVEEAYSLQGLGNLIASSQPEEGHALQRQALALWREIGDVVEMIESLTVLLPWILYQRRELAEVEQLAREAQALARNLDDPASRALAAQCLAMMLWMRGNLQEGCSVAEEAIRSNEAAGNRFALANLYHCLSHGLLLSGLYAQARENLARALPLAEETGNGAAHFSTRFCQLWLAVAEGAPVAIEQNRHAFDEFCQTSYGPNIPVWANWVRALAAMALGRLDEARRNLLSLARSVAGEGLPGKFVESILPCAALLEAKRGRIERAVELDALWQTFDIALQYRFHVDFFHRPIAEAAKALPPEVVAAAQERGRVRDWEATVQELIAELSAPSNV